MRPPTDGQQQETNEQGKAYRLRGGEERKVCLTCSADICRGQVLKVFPGLLHGGG